MNVKSHGQLISWIRSLGILSLGTLTTVACVSTENGTTFSGPNVGREVTIYGYYTEPNVGVAIQVLNSPNNDPLLDGNWITVANTVTSSTVSLVWNNTENLYKWSADDAVLVPSILSGARWPESGLVKVRAKLANGILSPTLDDTECMSEQHNLGETFLSAVITCQSHDSGNLTLVDIDDANGNVPDPSTPFLSYKQTTANQAIDYYKAVGALNVFGLPTPARGTFNAWKATNGFPAGEIVATYYNSGDLGFGRDMHCRTTGSGKACYVTNYGTVNDGLADLHDGTALADAIAHQNPGATVAMEWHQFVSATQNPVRFFVYDTTTADGDPADGSLITQISLDSNPTAQPVPGLCMACHGGTYRPADGSGPARVEGAQFLPFDIESFGYHPSLTQDDQQAAFESLNLLVKATVPPGSSTHELISGWYAVPGAFDGTFVPASWQGSKESKALYKYVYRPYCQTCHTAQANAPKTFANFSAYGSYIADITCGPEAGIRMPHAEVTFESFWKSSARAHLTAALGIRDACNGK